MTELLEAEWLVVYGLFLEKIFTVVFIVIIGFDYRQSTSELSLFVTGALSFVLKD